MHLPVGNVVAAVDRIVWLTTNINSHYNEYLQLQHKIEQVYWNNFESMEL